MYVYMQYRGRIGENMGAQFVANIYRIQQNFRGFRSFLANGESFPLESFAAYST